MFRMGQGACLSRFSYKGCRFTRKGQCRTKVTILRLAVGYLNATISRKTRNIEPEIGTDGTSQTRQNPRVDGYGSGFASPSRSMSCFWTVLEPNRTILVVRNRTAGGLPGPVANTTWRPWKCELGGCDRATLEMHLEAIIEWDWKSTWRWSIWRVARRELRLNSLVNS